MWLFAIAAAGAAAEPSRVPVIAIVSESTLQREADLLVATLSKSPAVRLVDRAQILALAGEHKLKDAGLTEKSSIELGQLLSADGVLFLVETESSGRKMIEARLTAVHPGIILEDVLLPQKDSLPDETATQVASRIIPLLPKLTVAQSDAICVSIAGFFAPTDSPQLRGIEQELSLLALHRMTHEPSFFVLERKRMDQLIWEKELSQTPEKPSRTGTWIIEGKFELHGEELALEMMLRKPSEKGQKFTLKGYRNHLPALAEKMMVALREAVKAGVDSSAWKPVEEAAFFADQAAWALDHEIIDASIAAAESAWALGQRDRSITEMRIKAYSLAAFPLWRDAPNEKIPRGGFNIQGYHYKSIDTQNSRALLAAIRALEICTDCNAAAPESRPISYEHYAKRAMLAGSAVLSSYFLQDHYKNHSQELAYLRSLLREVSLWFDQLPVPKDLRDSICEIRAAYAPLWCESTDEVLEQYRRSLRPAKLTDPTTHDDVDIFFGYHIEYERGYREDDVELRASLSQRPLPWVFAWNPEKNQARQLEAMRKLQALISSPTFEDQTLGWFLLAIYQKDFPSASDAQGAFWRDQFAKIFSLEKTVSYEQFVSKGVSEFLWQWRNTIIHEYRDGTALYNLGGTLRKGNRETWMRFVRFMVAEAGRKQMNLYWRLTNDFKFSEAETQELTELNRSRTQDYPGPFEADIDWGIRERKPAKQLTPKVTSSSPKPPPAPTAPTAPSPPPLLVNRFWNPMTHPDTGDWKPESNISFRKAAYAEGKLWFFGCRWKNGNLIGQVSLDTFQTTYEKIPLEVTHNESYGIEDARLQITPDAVYLPHAESLKKWDRKTGKWSEYKLPDFVYGAQLLGESVYLFYDVGTPTLGISLKENSTRGSGILRIDRASDQVSLIASSRRRPAQSVLDARPVYLPLGVFGSKGKLPGAVVQSLSTGDIQIYREAASQQDWELLYTIPYRKFIQCLFQPCGDGLLIHTHSPHTPAEFFDLTLIRGDGSSEVLLSNPCLKGPTMPGMARWDIPPNMRDSNNKGWGWRAELYQDRLYCLVSKNRQRNLLIYSPGQRNPVSIPLSMELSEADETMLIHAHYEHTDTPVPSDKDRRSTLNSIKGVDSLMVSPEGVILSAWGQTGFWFLPHADIEKWISTHP